MIQLTKKEIELLKIKAYNLYVESGITAKEISKTIPVTEKSIGVWVKQYGWKDLRKTKDVWRLGGKNGSALALNGFVIFLRDKHPLVYSEIMPLMELYNESKSVKS
ncbi:hypothetical protein [Mucilaginibacter sp.]|uniref:hypothetical protein n=1 Tax=Mucilaginibacter sp. TaxID=1882438 RepID=UPI0025DEAFCF|nr:hypothetical protein [Mucilaginibacter sp.]